MRTKMSPSNTIKDSLLHYKHIHDFMNYVEQPADGHLIKPNSKINNLISKLTSTQKYYIVEFSSSLPIKNLDSGAEYKKVHFKSNLSLILNNLFIEQFTANFSIQQEQIFSYKAKVSAFRSKGLDYRDNYFTGLSYRLRKNLT